MTRKEQLQQELREIKAQEAKDLAEKHLPDLRAKYEGKYFKCRNGYSDGSKWWMYAKVISIVPDSVYSDSEGKANAHCHTSHFQTDSEGVLTIKARGGYNFIHTLGTEITKEEFLEAWHEALKPINNLF